MTPSRRAPMVGGGARFPRVFALIVAAILSVTGASVVAHASPTTLNWGHVTTTQAPPARLFGAMAFDSARNRTVLFGGGSAGFTNYNDTWEFDGANWVQRTPATSPPALVGSAMAFDSNRSVSVMFGGQAPTSNTSDTWEWNGTNWLLRTPGTAPSARLWAAMAYDSTRHRTVLFGGSGAGGTYLGDTWEYDGSTWTQMTPASSPTARISTMAFDPSLGQVVLFGGRDNAGHRLNDTWEWDGLNWTQKTLDIPLTPPFERFWHTMAFDPQVGHVVFFGGDHLEPYSLGATNDTWEWDGTKWTQDWTSVTPSARSGQTMALDANGRIVLFGGSDGGNPGVFATDTLELGTGIATPPGNPAVTFNPTSQDFGQVDIGATSAPGHVLIYSSGTAPLLSTISITGDFAVSSTYCPTSPNPLAAGMICFVFMTFTPTGAGDRFGSLVFTDNGPGGSQMVPLHGIGIGSDFSISASPTSLSMFPGSSATSTISTTLIGSAGTVTLSALTNDPGVTATFSPTSVPAGSASTMTVVLAPTIAPGFYGVRVVGTEGPLSRYVDVSVRVIAPPDFSISASPISLSVVQGSTAVSSISTTQIGSSGSIDLSISVSPAGLTATVNPTFVSSGSNATLTASPDLATTPGTYTVTVTGTEGSATHSTSVTVTVTPVSPDFSISAYPTSITVVQGGTAAGTISTVVIGAPGTVNLAAAVSPAGLTVILSPTSISAGGGSTLTVNPADRTAPGNYTVTVTGTEGSTTHSTSVAVTVTPKGIVNGGFETGDFTGWTVTGKTAIVKTAHTGKFAARVGSPTPSTTSTLAQTFSVPAAGGKLSFWYRMTCPDTLSNDWFTVTLHDNATGATTTLKSRGCSTTTWTHVTANLSAHAGHSVTLTFLNHDDNQQGDASFTLVDDVTLT